MCSALLSLRGLWIRALRCRGRPLSTNFCQARCFAVRGSKSTSRTQAETEPFPTLSSSAMSFSVQPSARELPRAVLLAHLPPVAHGDLRSIPKGKALLFLSQECDTATRGKKGSMSTKVGLVVGFAAGYYLSAKAGHERVRAAESMDRAGPRGRPRRTARDLVDQVGEKAKEAVDSQVNSMRASSPSSN